MHPVALLSQLYEEDFGGADLLIVMGTSLVVNPFASLIGGLTCGFDPGGVCVISSCHQYFPWDRADCWCLSPPVLA
jgi:NAD-dependent SIR2 family protein deacetylase